VNYSNEGGNKGHPSVKEVNTKNKETVLNEKKSEKWFGGRRRNGMLDAFIFNVALEKTSRHCYCRSKFN
jgi:hypothetical protein